MVRAFNVAVAEVRAGAKRSERWRLAWTRAEADLTLDDDETEAEAKARRAPVELCRLSPAMRWQCCFMCECDVRKLGRVAGLVVAVKLGTTRERWW
jgi:hypothetical protein